MENATTKSRTSITVRLIPEDVIHLLDEMATKEGRSLEAQARHAICMSVLPLQIENERRKRVTGLAKRLNFAYRIFLDRNPDQSDALSRIAEGIGMEVAEPVRQWFCGDKEPAFSQVRAIASYLGCNYDWLQHGEGDPFQSEVFQQPEIMHEMLPSDSTTFVIHHYYDIGDQRVAVQAPYGSDPRRAAIYLQLKAEEWFGDSASVSNLGIAAALVAFYGCTHGVRSEHEEHIDMYTDRSAMLCDYANLISDPSLVREGLRDFLARHLVGCA